jgi:hypothetical protein
MVDLIRPEQVAFDIDGVFADTMALFLEIAKKEYGINHIRYEDITHYYLEECLDIAPESIASILNYILEGDFREELKPIEGSCEILSALAHRGPLLFVTARPAATAIREWVHDMLPGVPHAVEVVATGSFEAKGEVLKSRGVQYFVEDYLEACFALERHHISPILFHQPWNRHHHPFREVACWSEIGDLIDVELPT